MAVTHDPEFPPQIAALFQTFNRCADGCDPWHVMEAAFNLAIAAIVAMHGPEREEAIEYAAEAAEKIAPLVAAQYDRPPNPADVVVPMQGH